MQASNTCLHDFFTEFPLLCNLWNHLACCLFPNPVSEPSVITETNDSLVIAASCIKQTITRWNFPWLYQAVYNCLRITLDLQASSFKFSVHGRLLLVFAVTLVG